MRISNRIGLRLAQHDHQVNNVEYSHGGGLQAHNYWDNEVDFVPQLVEIVRAIVAGKLAFEGEDNRAA